MYQIEGGKFNPNLWYENVVRISQLPSLQKYQELTKLHNNTLFEYIRDLENTTDEEADSISSDGRLRKILVAHIMGWEEFQIQVFIDKDPATRLRKQLDFQSFIDPDTGKKYDFSNPQNDRQKSVDDFNAYHAEKYQDWSWTNIRTRAIDTAQRLRKCFPNEPSEEWLNFLENSPSKTWKIKEGLSMTIPAGYYLWIVSLKHEAIEHRRDIALIK